jgi:hypothetical protein
MTKFLLLTSNEGGTTDVPMTEWDPADITAHLEFLRALNQELAENGELVETLVLAGPELAKRVTSDGAGTPVITDGPFPEAGAARGVPPDRCRIGGARARDRGAGVVRTRARRDPDRAVDRGAAGDGDGRRRAPRTPYKKHCSLRRSTGRGTASRSVPEAG